MSDTMFRKRDLPQRIELVSSLFNLKGKRFVPYQQFYPMFEEHQPITTVWKTGRQVSKTTTSCIQTILQCATIPNFVTTYVMPQESQAANTSILFFKPILDESPIAKVCPTTRDQTMKYQFANNSAIVLSYAYHDPERTRGIPSDKVHVDEAQGINEEFLPVIEASASASPYRFIMYTGTPKTHQNTLQSLWNNSSQAEWAIKCKACNHWNIPSIKHDILDMIEPPGRRPVSYESPGTVCAKCKKGIYPQEGQWVHAFPERRWINAGYHVPQIVVELHYADPVKWAIICGYKQGLGRVTYDDFLREVLGEPADASTRLVSLTDLLKQAKLGSRYNEETILQTLDYYRLRAFGIDWGGGGKQGNFTTIALVCLAPDGRVHVPWATALPNPHDHIGEGETITRLAERFRVQIVAHDCSGAGSLRETILIQSGFPAEKLMPCRYVRLREDVTLRYIPAAPHNPKPLWDIDSSRALLMVVGAIKLGYIEFFDDDYQGEANKGLLRHFLALVDEVKSDGSTKHFKVACEEGLNDEFAQATMLGCLAIWNSTGTWPRYGG